MKILYMTIFYSINGNGLYQNLTDALSDNDHDITIVRSSHDINKTTYQKIRDNLSVLSVKTADPFSRGPIKKGINQILMARSFKSAIKNNLKDKRFDIILYATPPVTLARAVRYCRKKYRAKTFLMLKDIFPQNAVDLDMFGKRSLIYKYFRRQEKLYYKYSDYIGCMSQGNKDYVIAHNPEVDPDKVHIFPNSIKISDVKDLSFHPDKTVFITGGNLGKPQNIPFLLEIIRKLADYKKAEFVIVGDGTEKEKILEFRQKLDLPNFIYKEQVPQKEYEEMLSSADVGLISLDPRFTIPNIPSRFQTYLKLKKPVFAMTDTSTDLREMIEEHDCGWWCEASDESLILETIKAVCENKGLQKEKGRNGFEYLKREFDVRDNVKKIEDFYKAC